MNACIQCLSHLPTLRTEFLKSHSNGQLAIEFSEMIAKLWSGAELFEPYCFKRAVEKWAPQFSGYRQQDSQEFLRFLLDGLHENLNRIKTKPAYTELKDIDNENDLDKSERWWRNYCERNDSVITGNLFKFDI
jgi:ubiquitin C-terminal hydrolase